MHATDITAWAARLIGAARATLGDAAESPLHTIHPDYGQTLDTQFSDELGHRRAVDVPFLAMRRAVRPASPAPTSLTPDVALWWAVHDPASPIAHLLAPGSCNSPDNPAPVLSAFPAPQIEVWTESDLSALHALWALANLRNDRSLARRALAAARWHVQNIQPDNATHHPWAIHVFIIASRRTADPAFEFHAQGMFHAAIVANGRPDRFSAHILADAAAQLVLEPPDPPAV